MTRVEALREVYEYACVVFPDLQGIPAVRPIRHLTHKGIAACVGKRPPAENFGSRRVPSGIPKRGYTRFALLYVPVDTILYAKLKRGNLNVLDLICKRSGNLRILLRHVQLLGKRRVDVTKRLNDLFAVLDHLHGSVNTGRSRLDQLRSLTRALCCCYGRSIRGSSGDLGFFLVILGIVLIVTLPGHSFGADRIGLSKRRTVCSRCLACAGRRCGS